MAIVNNKKISNPDHRVGETFAGSKIEHIRSIAYENRFRYQTTSDISEAAFLVIDNYNNGFGRYKNLCQDYDSFKVDYSIVKRGYIYNPFEECWDFSDYEILHKNGDKEDNRIENKIVVDSRIAATIELIPFNNNNCLVSRDGRYIIAFNYLNSVYSWELITLAENNVYSSFGNYLNGEEIAEHYKYIKLNKKETFIRKEKEGGLNAILHTYWTSRINQLKFITK